MIKTPLSTANDGAFWTPGCTIIGGASKTFNQIIKSLFANNEQGFAYDPNDLTTMYQDAAGTIPVTGVGQPVGLMKDKSGRGNHARQTVSASRPILRQNITTGANYLEFDGSDDFLRAASIDFTSTDKVTVVTVIKKQTEAEAVIIDHGIGQEKSFRLQRGGGHDSQALYIFMQPPITILNIPLVDAPAGVGLVVTQKLSRTTSPSIYIKVNTKTHQNTSVMNAGNFGNYPLHIGRLGGTSLPFNGHIYGLIAVGKLATDNETAVIEKELAKRTGVTLNV